MKKIADLDINGILDRKARGRKRLSGLSFGEKVRIVEAMRERAEPFRRARESRATGKPKSL